LFWWQGSEELLFSGGMIMEQSSREQPLRLSPELERSIRTTSGLTAFRIITPVALLLLTLIVSYVLR
jgi:hypothetical protein